MTEQLEEAKKTCAAHEERYETEVSGLISIYSSNILMWLRSAGTMAHVSGPAVVPAECLKLKRDEVRESYKAHDECRLTWETFDFIGEGRFTLTKRIVYKMWVRLRQSSEIIVQLYG